MSRRLPILPLVALVLLVGCRERDAWQRPGWQPERPPQRIVVASVLAAESLLGVVDRDRIAGVHEVAADPGYSLAAARARGLPRLGATPEQLLSVDPDLVLLDAYTQAETVDLLSMAGVPVVRTLDPHGFADIEENLRTFGRVTHDEARFEAVIVDMRERLRDVRERARELPSWRLLCLDGALHTYGAGSLFDAAATAAGARNLAAEHGVGAFRKLDIEEVLALDPDAIVLSGDADATGLPRWIEQCPGLDLLRCLRDGRLLYVPGPMLSTTSHHLVDTAAFIQSRLREWGRR